MTAALRTTKLAKRYGRRRALAECTLSIPGQRVVGLVGPNGAGKTTLLHLAVGLLQPSAGSIEVLGGVPGGSPAQLARVGFVGQESPLYARLTVGQHLEMGRWLNPAWDERFARERLGALGLDPAQRCGTLSGGQRAQLALTLAVAKRPELLVLDEPVAALDPLARREFLQTLMEVVADRQVSVLMSSHLVADLERICDYLVVLVAGQVALEGDVETLLASHHRLRGPAGGPGLGAGTQVLETSTTGRQTTVLARSRQPVFPGGWEVTPVDLEDLVLSYLRQARDGQPTPAAPLAVAE